MKYYKSVEVIVSEKFISELRKNPISTEELYKTIGSNLESS